MLAVCLLLQCGKVTARQLPGWVSKTMRFMCMQSALGLNCPLNQQFSAGAAPPPAGFPGAVNCTVTYTLRDDEGGEYGRLEYEVTAVSSQPTPASVYLHP